MTNSLKTARVHEAGSRRRFLRQCAVASLGAAGASQCAVNLFAAETLAAAKATLLAPAEDAVLAQRVSDEAVAQRKRMVLQAIAADPSFSPTRKNPKYQHAQVGAKLSFDPKDKAALDYVQRMASFPDHFAYQGLAALYGRFGDTWRKEVVAAVRESVLHWQSFLRGGTENMVAMERCAAVIFGERFPDDTFHYNLTGRQLVGEGKKFMRAYGRAVFAGSMCEYLSPIYVATNSAAWANTASYARDAEARLMSEAVLDWMYADVAVNTFGCSTVPPVQREKGLITGTYQRSFPETNTQWVSWMFFGGGSMKAEGDKLPADHQPFKAPIGFHAFSPWTPHPIIRNLGAQRVAAPYSVRQARAGWTYIEPTMVNAHGKTAAAEKPLPGLDGPRYHFRSAYFHRAYALGTGSFKADPSQPLTHSVLPFGIWWDSPHENNFLLVAHPFWFASRPGDEGEAPLGDDDRLGISPFCRTVHHENAAVLLYDLPEDDPYANLEKRGGEKFSSARTAKVIQSIFVHVPETVTERVQTDAGFFLREGDVYIALRPLTAGAKWTASKHKGFVRLQIPGPVTGVALEVGDRREYGSFQQFQAKVSQTKLDLSRLSSAKTVEYTSTRGACLRVASVPGTWLPDASINGTKLDFERWPICESPYVKCEDRVLDVNDGRCGFTIDWRGDLPSYTYYDWRNGQRVPTSRRFIRNGQLITERA